MRLLAGTVVANHPDSPRWYKLQQDYLERTTKHIDLDTVCVLNKVKNLLPYRNIVNLNLDLKGKSTDNFGKQHALGLNQLLGYFRKHAAEYDRFLILDSDCFPFRENWMTRISLEMQRNGHDMAAVVRFENLGHYIHPCAVLLTREALAHWWLDFSWEIDRDLIGEPQKDAGARMFYRDKCLPLIRTNRVNVHPVWCGIYADCFYHHCAGSRWAGWRGNRIYYNKTAVPHNANSIAAWKRQLFKNPDEFIRKLVY